MYCFPQSGAIFQTHNWVLRCTQGHDCCCAHSLALPTHPLELITVPRLGEGVICRQPINLSGFKLRLCLRAAESNLNSLLSYLPLFPHPSLISCYFPPFSLPLRYTGPKVSGLDPLTWNSPGKNLSLTSLTFFWFLLKCHCINDAFPKHLV